MVTGLLTLGCVSVVAAGCGPSLVQVRLADQYFERCYAGDRDPRYSDVERRGCWDAWLADYTIGQSDERMSHARERLLMLDPQDSAMMELATGELEMTSAESEGLPVESAPVVVLTRAATGTIAPTEGSPREETPELRARHRPSIPRASTARCDSTCLPPWEGCVDACTARDRGCYNACRLRFRTCAAACY